MTTVGPENERESQATQPLEPVTAELGSQLAATDRCPNCGTRMAPDQRYCINCGERRSGGGLRDALPRTAVATTTTVRERRTFFASPNSSLIAGVATLLIALGVGVLIGRTGHTNNAANAKPQVVTVQTAGGTSSGSAATTAAAATAAGTAAHHAANAAHHKAAKTHAASNTAQQKTAAQNGVKLPPPVVKVGGKCTAGAKGCQGGKFTGNFFGG